MIYFPKFPQRGFTLIELSVVLAIIAVVIGGTLSIMITASQASQYNATIATMDTIDSTLVNFANSNGRIPCPGDLTIAKGGTNYGREAGYQTGGTGTGECFTGMTPAANFKSASGVEEGSVPTRALSLPDSYMYDGWGRKIRYVVDPTYTLSATSRTSWPIPYNMCTTPSAKSITINDASGNPKSTAAVYALISHGANGHGGYTSSGLTVNAGSTNADEQTNCHCDSTGAHTGGAGVLSGTTYVQKMLIPNASSPLAGFNDIVSYKEGWQMQTSTNQLVQANCPKYLYAVDATSSGGKVWIYSFSTATWTSLAYASFNFATSIAADSAGNIYVTESGPNVVHKYTTSSGTWNHAFISTGSGPDNIYIDSYNNIYVVDYTANDFRKYDSTGALKATYVGNFSSPSGGVADSFGNLWVGDSGAGHTVVKKCLVSANCTVAGNWTAISSPTGGFGTSSPQGIFPDSSGNIWAVDSGNNKVYKYTPSTSSWSSAYTSSFNNPQPIAVDLSGNIYVGDQSNKAIKVYNSSTGQWSTLKDLTTLSASFTIAGLWVGQR